MNGYYKINKFGEVKSNNGKIRKGRYRDSHKYITILLNKDGKRWEPQIGTLLLLTFVGPKPSEEYTCDHIDRNTINNSLENLRWANKHDQNVNRNYDNIKKRSYYMATQVLPKYQNDPNRCRKISESKKIKRRCIETGIIYNSMKDANIALGKRENSSEISRSVKTGNTAYGFHWENIL